MNKKEIFGGRLKDLRKGRKLTQPKLAGDLGVATHTIKNWERGVNIPSLETLCKIADYFGVSLDYLAGRKDEG